MVVHRGALAVQPRREDDPATAGREGLGDVVDATKDVDGDRRLAELVVREEDVVAQPVEARARGLLLVGDVVLAGQRRRQRRDAADDVGPLERDMARDPRRRAYVQVALVVADCP